MFFEILELTQRPELNQHEKLAVLTKFSKRFARIVQGKLLEGAWKKKMVGLRDEMKEDENASKPPANNKELAEALKAHNPEMLKGLPV